MWNKIRFFIMLNEKNRLIHAIEKAIKDEDIEYIICEDLIEFEKYGKILSGKDYVIREFGEYWVALIFH